VEAALERYASRGDWQKAIAIAEKKVIFASVQSSILHFYLSILLIV